MSFVDFIKSDIYYSSKMSIYGQFTDIMPGLFYIFIQDRGEKKWFTFTIYSFRRSEHYENQSPIDFDDFVFIILLVQSVINLENIGQKTLEKPEGAVKSGQFRNTSHIRLKSLNDNT
jgi:hypothetical protein